jgi:hypothetical protein
MLRRTRSRRVRANNADTNPARKHGTICDAVSGFQPKYDPLQRSATPSVKFLLWHLLRATRVSNRTDLRREDEARLARPYIAVLREHVERYATWFSKQQLGAILDGAAARLPNPPER